MIHLNYCESLINFLTEETRKAVRLVNRKGKKNKEWEKDAKRRLKMWKKHIDLLKEATKYILPFNGNIITDPNLTHIAGTRLELPYKKTILEIPSGQNSDPTKTIETKIVLILVDQGDTIEIQCYMCRTPWKIWTMTFPIQIGKDWSLTMTHRGVEINPIKAHPSMSNAEASVLLRASLGFLNALASPAIKVEKKYTKTQSNHVHTARTDEPIREEYHYVFIDIPKKIYENSSTSNVVSNISDDRYRPREHEREGHWRHFKNGTKTWINTQTINKGIGKRIEKKYVIRGPKQQPRPEGV